MWIVRLALRRPYTFVVMGLAILLLGIAAIVTTPSDIFPEIDIPVVSVIWNYDGLTTEDMASRITTFSEYTISSAVSDVRSIESHTYPGVGVIKIYFQPNVNVEGALAQVTAVSQTILRRMPPGAVPPFILQYNASSVPIIQLALSGKAIPEAQLYDYGIYRIRQQVAPIQGITLPLPYGGKPRQIMVDLDPQALLAKSISAADVSNAVNLQNLTLPSGSVKLGPREYRVSLNSSPDAVAALNDLPVKYVNGAVVYVRDVAHVRDGFAVQTNIVRQDGRRSALLTVIKKGGASTLTSFKQLKALLPSIRAAAPPGLEVKELFDQSLFVRAAIAGVLTEGAIAACLTGLMILLFLGSWRSTLVVITSIPLSILTSLAILSAIGQTLNVMTLGGLALAVGILVDDATVEIENIHRNLGLGKRLVQAILDGAQQIATPAFVSTLSICIVFVPVVFLTGPAKYLFTPLALAVVFAMLASYLLSRTIVPTLVRYLLGAEVHDEAGAGVPSSFFGRIHAGFQRQFERLRTAYVGVLETALARRGRVFVVFGVIALSGAALLPFVGRDFFPEVDTGQFRLHVRAPAGTRIEETEQVFAQVEASIRRQIPRDQIQLIIDNIGQPQPINLAFTDSVTIGPSAGRARPDSTRRGQQRPRHLELERGRRAELLVGSPQRHQLRRGGPDAAGPGRLGEQPHEHVGDPGDRRTAAAAQQSGHARAAGSGGGPQPLERAAGVRRVRQRSGSRPRHRRRRRPADRGRAPAQIAAGPYDLGARPGREHELGVPAPGSGPDLRRPARLHADGGQLPVLARPVHHHHRATGRPLRHRVDALRHPHDVQRARPDGRHHERRRGHREQHPDGDLRERPDAGGPRRPQRRARRGRHALAAGADDRAGHDHRDAADVTRPRRGRRAERAARARGHRRPDGGDLRHALPGASRLQHPAAASAPAGLPGRFRARLGVASSSGVNDAQVTNRVGSSHRDRASRGARRHRYRAARAPERRARRGLDFAGCRARPGERDRSEARRWADPPRAAEQHPGDRGGGDLRAYQRLRPRALRRHRRPRGGGEGPGPERHPGARSGAQPGPRRAGPDALGSRAGARELHSGAGEPQPGARGPRAVEGERKLCRRHRRSLRQAGT